jgi:hypothetical protein
MQYARATLQVKEVGSPALSEPLFRTSEGLTDSSSERIGFVVSCVFASAINNAELRQWAQKVLDETANPPLYITELTLFTQPLFEIYNVIGFAPRWSHTEDSTLAISGIAFKRDRQPFNHPIMRDESLRKLAANPQIEKRFRAEFPFLIW